MRALTKRDLALIQGGTGSDILPNLYMELSALGQVIVDTQNDVSDDNGMIELLTDAVAEDLADPDGQAQALADGISLALYEADLATNSAALDDYIGKYADIQNLIIANGGHP